MVKKGQPSREGDRRGGRREGGRLSGDRTSGTGKGWFTRKRCAIAHRDSAVPGGHEKGERGTPVPSEGFSVNGHVL